MVQAKRERTVTMRSLGSLGRAGNQFFQYTFLKTYCKQHNLWLQLPKWVGNGLFGFKDDPITLNLPRYRESRFVGTNGQGEPPEGTELAGHDFHGFAQYHTSYYEPVRDWILESFRPLSDIMVAKRLCEATSRLRGSGRTVIGIHLRRGDYGLTHFPVIPTKWYLRWLANNRLRFFSPLLFIATEDVNLIEDFADCYDMATASGLGVPLSNKPMEGYNYLQHELRLKESVAMDWYPDFYLLSQCDVILAPSSTFSFFAAMLAPHLTEYWRASLKAGGFVREDPWNACPLLRERVVDYEHIPGIRLKENPYWT